jgi:hypothetical protein
MHLCRAFRVLSESLRCHHSLQFSSPSSSLNRNRSKLNQPASAAVSNYDVLAHGTAQQIRRGTIWRLIATARNTLKSPQTATAEASRSRRTAPSLPPTTWHRLREFGRWEPDNTGHSAGQRPLTPWCNKVQQYTERGLGRMRPSRACSTLGQAARLGNHAEFSTGGSFVCT